MSFFLATDLAAAKKLANSALVTPLSILRPSRVATTGGGRTSTYTSVFAGNGRVTPKGGMLGDTQGNLFIVAAYTVHFPVGTDIKEQDVVVSGTYTVGQTVSPLPLPNYVVEAVYSPESDSVWERADCKRVAM